MMLRQGMMVSWRVLLLLLGLAVGGLAPGMGVLGVAQGVVQTVEQRKVEAYRLLQQGIQQYQVSQFTAALQSWQQSLKLYREIKDRRGEGNALGNLNSPDSFPGVAQEAE